MDVMLVVDMQVGLLNGEPKHDLGGVIASELCIEHAIP